MVCLPNCDVLGPGVLTAPLLLARGLTTRATHWLVLSHQRHLQKLSLRRNQKSRSVSGSDDDGPCNEPLVPKTPETARERPVSEPAISSTLSSCDVDSPATCRPTVHPHKADTKKIHIQPLSKQFQRQSSSDTFLHGTWKRERLLSLEDDKHCDGNNTYPKCHKEGNNNNNNNNKEGGLCPYPVTGNCPCRKTEGREGDAFQTPPPERPRSCPRLWHQLLSGQVGGVGRLTPRPDTPSGICRPRSETPTGKWRPRSETPTGICRPRSETPTGKWRSRPETPTGIWRLRSETPTDEGGCWSDTDSRNGDLGVTRSRGNDGVILLNDNLIFISPQDGSRSGPNQQHSSVGSNAPHSRLPVPPPGLPSRAKPSNLTRPAAPIPGSVNNSQNKTGPHSSVPNIQDWPQKASSGGLAASQSKPQKLAAGSGSPVLPRTPLQHHPQFNVMPPQVSSPPLERAPSRPPSVTPLQNSGERIPIGDGESIFLTPLYRTLYDRPFFHVISRSKSKLLLENAADGVYLIRPSTRSSDPLTLCLQYSGRTYHINIRKRGDGLYALGKEKVNEMTFNSVDDLVSTYTNEPIKLQSGDRVQLRSSPAKSDHIYVKLPSNFQKRY